MKLTIYSDTNERVHETEDNVYITTKLLEVLFNKYVVQIKGMRINYKYNYSDEQTITITHSNKFKEIYEGIPTKLGWLDIYKLRENIKES